VPLLGEVTTSVTHVNQELVRVDAITANVQSISGNVSALTSLFAATLGSPIIKVAAVLVRRALGRRSPPREGRQPPRARRAQEQPEDRVTRRLFYIAMARRRRSRRPAGDAGGAALHPCGLQASASARWPG
jgi:hypothetical protein